MSGDDHGQGLSAEELEALLARLDPTDRERAALRYLELREKLTRLFVWRGAHPADELADETLNRASRRLADGVELQSGDPFPYLRGIAFLISKEVQRRSAQQQGALLVHPWPPAHPEADPLEERRLDCLDRCLASLPADERRQILRYHESGDRIRIRQELARELGLPLNSLRIRIHRLRKKLQACLEAYLERG